ncbi:MAG: leucine-rich repeat protein [Ruminococcus sp.]|uniref:leucine-rich repeat protein n=1 Tax=Ruminococcus sp. TaxID=41978 RepID=UPI0025EDB2E4|nr:leucine-rich repeat protein [Ruminococcus sp.]MBO4867381.1 leucine-rich repeat protein [Ruminococcus sp.]
MLNKKVAACLAAAVFVFGGSGILPVRDSIYSVSASAETYGDFYYEAVGGGVAITAYGGNGGKVLIPSKISGKKVVAIADNAFFQCDSVTSVTIPDTVVTIGESAFMECDSMTAVTIPDSVRTIGVCAFSGCTSLKSIKLPKNLQTVAESAFSDCTALKTVTIQDSAVTFKYEAFMGCTSLKTVTIPKNVVKIEEAAFGFSLDDNDTASYTKISGFKINCYMNSQAYIYAVEKRIAYEILDPETPDIIFDDEDEGINEDDLMPGDVNGDGSVNNSDIILTAANVKGVRMLNEKRRARADVNGDGKVNNTDVILIAAHVKGKKMLKKR